MRYPLIGIAAALALYTAPARGDEDRNWDFAGTKVTIESLAAESGGGQRLTVQRDGEILTIDDRSLRLREPVGTGVTGDATPQLVVTGWSGGDHCCHTIHIVDLGVHPRLIQRIAAGHSDQDLFAQLDDDPALEISLPDWSYAYWPHGFAQSPVPRVILHWDGRQYVPSARLMRNAAPLYQLRDRRQPQSEDEVIAAIFQDAVDLIYAGRLLETRTLLKQLLPNTAEAKSLHQTFFDCKLPASPWWPFIAQLNGVPATPTKPRNLCPGAEAG